MRNFAVLFFAFVVLLSNVSAYAGASCNYSCEFFASRSSGKFTFESGTCTFAPFSWDQAKGWLAGRGDFPETAIVAAHACSAYNDPRLAGWGADHRQATIERWMQQGILYDNIFFY